MKIKADIATAHSLLNDPKPDGIIVESAADSATKAFSLSVNLNITVDLAKIAAPIVSSWILSRAITSIGRGVNVDVNGKRLPPEEAEASKMIIDAINDEEKKKDTSQ